MNAVSTEKRKYQLKARAEAQERTRARIAAAASELHEEVGVADTTIAAIARRAGVQRLTVYNHFPDLATLLPACSAHWLSEHPPPDPTPAFELEDPADRVRVVLEQFYDWYRDNRRLQRNVHADRARVPELDDLMSQTVDAMQGDLAARLAASFGLRGKRAERLRALLAVALGFWTWYRLDAEGLGSEDAAALMTGAAASV